MGNTAIINSIYFHQNTMNCLHHCGTDLPPPLTKKKPKTPGKSHEIMIVIAFFPCKDLQRFLGNSSWNPAMLCFI